MAQLNECYSKELAGCVTDVDKEDLKERGGFPTIADLHMTYDYDQHFLPSMDKFIGGHRTVHRVFEALTAADPHAVKVDSVMSSELHVFEFYADPEGKKQTYLPCLGYEEAPMHAVVAPVDYTKIVNLPRTH